MLSYSVLLTFKINFCHVLHLYAFLTLTYKPHYLLNMVSINKITVYILNFITVNYYQIFLHDAFNAFILFYIHHTNRVTMWS